MCTLSLMKKHSQKGDDGAQANVCLYVYLTEIPLFPVKTDGLNLCLFCFIGFFLGHTQ